MVVASTLKTMDRYCPIKAPSVLSLGLTLALAMGTCGTIAGQQTPPPASPPAPASQTPAAQTSGYQDPLQQPITVAPGAATPPVTVAAPAPALTASLPPGQQAPQFDLTPETDHKDPLGSTYIPVDSWVYQAAIRLYSLGYLNSAFISMRPWTRRSLLHIVNESEPDIMADGNEQAMEILAKLKDYLIDEDQGRNLPRGKVYGLESAYTRLMGIGGLPLRDSFHLGETINNDYGRPYAQGFNNITGFSTVNEWGRFSLYARGEYQHSPSWPGYSYALASEISSLDVVPFTGSNVPDSGIPYGNTGAQNPFRLVEATLSYHLLGHEISGGKSDAWTGPAYGSAMGWSNNAENIYSFRINRVQPLVIPWFSKLFGPMRYDFFVGSLKGHTLYRDPWIHSELVSLRPTSNFEFTFQRSVIWGGEGHVPVTLHTFLRSFFSLQDTEGSPATKEGRDDPGARFSVFSFSWRLPFMSHSVTLYTDSICHDDVSPISAPRRAAYRPGVYISHIPGIPRLDFRVEAASTDTSTLRSLHGYFNYYESEVPQGYTNKGYIMGDWIGREAKGGQAWLTYHLSGNEWIQVEYLDKKTPKDFVPNGTTQGQFKIDVVKRFHRDIELNAWLQQERWVAPIYQSNVQHDTVVAAQVTWFPKLHSQPYLNGK